MPNQEMSASVESRPSGQQDTVTQQAPEDGRNFGPIGGFGPSDGETPAGVGDEDTGASTVPAKPES